MEKELLKQIILDFQNSSLPAFHLRKLGYQVVTRKALAFLGMRRVGKSTFLLQIIQELLLKKVPIQNILLINFFDERLLPFAVKDLTLLLETYYELYPEKRKTEQVHFFFDEIQVVQGFESFVDRLMRLENCQVYLTGSSSKMLSHEIASSLRGRVLSYEVFPFSYSEWVAAHHLKTNPLTSKAASFLRKAFGEYLVQGGFPEVLQVPEKTRVQILQEYYRTVVYRDIIERHDVAAPKKIALVMQYLSHQTAGLYTLGKLAEKLKSLGIPIQKMELSQIIDWMQDSYFFYSIPIYSESIARQNTNPKKGYLIDHALAASLNLGISKNTGRMLENWVFMELRRQTDKIFYYKSRSGREVDFLAIAYDRQVLIQVTERLGPTDESQFERETEALFEAMEELELEESFIVTLDQEETLERKSKTIKIVPAWKWGLTTILNEPSLHPRSRSKN